MADPSLQQWELTSFDQLISHNPWDKDLHHSISSDSHYLYQSASISSNTRGNDSSIDSSSYPAAETQQKMPRTVFLPPRDSSPRILSFGNPGSPEESYDELLMIATVNPVEGSSSLLPRRAKKTCVSAAKPSSLNHDHVLAERKRRERLSQKFIALSAMIPGLKKMDKASVLGDAIRYLKTLQEKVKSLEEQAAKKRSVGSYVLKKSKAIICECDEESSLQKEVDSDEPQPEIEVKLSDKTVLIKMYCEGRKGMLVRALSEVEKLHLAVVSMTAIPFAASSVDITIIAQIEEGFSMTVKDLTRKLSLAF
ncbi:hypothetical protein HPP92_024959 [Vanilla planifolia]|uniref:BHLH domain-containing protein n=1 Tax=Vanilla planifolia TaxID=51239 RepID=A0A835PT64_VANPL|nr:hypothetical protein HPP92_024959 [Vanilla planifolia]